MTASGKKLNDEDAIIKDRNGDHCVQTDETQVKTIRNKCQEYNFSHVNRSWK